MGVIFESGYSLPVSDQPLTHARIAHARNWLSGGTPSASGTDADFFEDAPANSLTYERWKPDALPATWEYDHGSAASCDYCCIGAHTMGTNGNSIEVQYHNGSNWVDLIPATALTDDMPIMAIFSEQTRQRWRIRISNGTVPEIGVVKFGKALQMERPIIGDHKPLALSRNTTFRSNISVEGEFLGRSVIRTNLKTGFRWNILTDAWVDANWPDLQKAVEKEPFFIAWRPLDRSHVALCQADDTPIPTYTGSRDFMRVSLNVTARGYD